MKKYTLLTLSTGISLSLCATPVASAEQNPFFAKPIAQNKDAPLESDHSANSDQLNTDNKKTQTGKCGAGKCSASKGEQGKCGAGKCSATKGEQGKCGTGKCSSDNKKEAPE